MIQVTGPDTLGLTADLMTLLDLSSTVILDMEQVLVRRHLTLVVVIEMPDALTALQTLLSQFARERHLDIDLQPLSAISPPVHLAEVVTVLGHGRERPLTASELAAVAGAISAAGGNIDRMVRLAKYPVYAYEFIVTNAAPIELRRYLGEAAAAHRLDVAVQAEGLGRRASRLVVLDVDSTLIQNEVIDLLADECGCNDAVAQITERAMAGELDFEASLRERVRLLKGLDESAVQRAQDRIQLTAGARTFVRTLKRLGYKVGIVSGGFRQFTDALAEDLELDHAVANELEIVDGKLTGEVTGPVVDRARKATLLKQFANEAAIPLSQVVAVGDGANDLDMLATAGLGIAFNAKPVVQEAADTTVNVPYLDAILFVLGVTRAEIEQADAVID